MFIAIFAVLLKERHLRWATEYQQKLLTILICRSNGMHKGSRRFQIRQEGCPVYLLLTSSGLSTFTTHFLFCYQNQTQAQPLLKTPPAVLQPIAQQTAFGVQAQPQPQSLLQAQISAASITPLLQTQPQPLLQQPQQKGAPSAC